VDLLCAVGSAVLTGEQSTPSPNRCEYCAEAHQTDGSARRREICHRLTKIPAMKPYVVCHMMPSVDGRLRTDSWDVPKTGHEEYERTADTYHADAWVCGRQTMEEFAKGRRKPTRRHTGKIPRTDYVLPLERARATRSPSTRAARWPGRTMKSRAIRSLRSSPRTYRTVTSRSCAKREFPTSSPARKQAT